MSPFYANPPVLKDIGLLCNCTVCCSQLVKILIALEPYGMLGSNVAYLIILTLFCHPGMQNGDKRLPRIILTVHDL